MKKVVRARIEKTLVIVIGTMLPVAASHALPMRFTDDLVGEWLMSSVVNTATDTSGLGNHGTVVGGAVQSYGWTGTAANLINGSYIQAPSAPSLNVGTGSFTLAAWVRMASPSSSSIKTIIDNRSSVGAGGYGYTFAVYNGNRLFLQLADTSGYTNYMSNAGSGSLAANRWHHVAVTVDRTSTNLFQRVITFYIDGKPVGTATPRMGNLTNIDRPFYIGGHRDTPSDHFNDRIDQVHVYRRAMPGLHIAAMSFPGNPTFSPGFWNIGGLTQYNNNCYNYATNKLTNTFAQPGRAAGAQWTGLTCAAVTTAAIADGLVPISSYPLGKPQLRSPLALVVAPGIDYHWYRLDTNGYWTHKPGGTEATNLDNANNPILDPRTADRGRYTDFCGFFLAWSDAVEGQGHENVN
ncbi:MAG: LamG domain-containing protein [Lysobacter sp.]|nr:MAG: LamG domain-containing protein [Lysobacter sp.]